MLFKNIQLVFIVQIGSKLDGIWKTKTASWPGEVLSGLGLMFLFNGLDWFMV